MKTHLLTLAGVIVAGFLVAAPAQSAPPVDKAALNKIYREGVAAYKKRDYANAERKFKHIQRAIPGEPKSQLREIANKRRAIAAVPAMQKQLEKIIVPKVEFEEATLEEAFEFVRIKSKELTSGNVVPNFILRAGNSGIDKKEITLSLANVPMSEVLKYIGRLADTKFEFQKHAIVAKPFFSSPPKVAAPKADLN